MHYDDRQHQKQQQENEENNNNRNKTIDKGTEKTMFDRKGRGRDYFSSIVTHNKVDNLYGPRDTLSLLCFSVFTLLGLIY